MRILYFTQDYSPHDYRFMAALAETEHEVFYLRLENRRLGREDRPLPPSIQLVKWAGGERLIKIVHGPRLLWDLRRVLREVQPDVLHAGPMQNAALLGALSGFQPMVSMSWGYDMLVDANKNKRNRWSTKIALQRSAVFVCDNDAVQAKAAAFGFPEERMVKFPWGVDIEHFSPGKSELRARKGWEDAVVLLHTRTWAPIYGVDVFAKAFAKAAREVPELRLFMLGKGPLAREIRSIFVGNGVDGMVQYAGQVGYDNLPDYYRAANLYVSASHTDGSSVSLMEALACGVPVLVSDIPGNQEWVTQEVGWQFPDGDVYALADAIVAAARAKSERQQMRKAAREKAEAKADWSKNFKKLLEAYKMARRER